MPTLRCRLPVQQRDWIRISFVGRSWPRGQQRDRARTNPVGRLSSYRAPRGFVQLLLLPKYHNSFCSASATKIESFQAYASRQLRASYVTIIMTLKCVIHNEPQEAATRGCVGRQSSGLRIPIGPRLSTCV